MQYYVKPGCYRLARYGSSGNGKPRTPAVQTEEDEFRAVECSVSVVCTGYEMNTDSSMRHYS